MSQRNVHLWESPYDLKKLHDAKLNYCIAKSVIDKNGEKSFNMVWKSLNLAPRAKISWTVDYALNWTLDVPNGNATVTLGGDWQPCDPGDVYDIDKYGLFTRSTAVGKDGFLKIGKNNYSYGGTSGLFIVIGVKSPSGDYEPIFTDTSGLALGFSAWYQPQEQAQWWYEGGVQSSTMITGSISDICTYDLTQRNPNTGTYYVSTNFTWDDGIWHTSLNPPPPVHVTGLARAFGTDPGSSNETHVDRIRRNLASILEDLNVIDSQDSVEADEDVSTYYGIVIFVAATVLAAPLIAAYLRNRNYRVSFTSNRQKTEFEFVVTRRRGDPGQELAVAGAVDVVPPEVTADWDAAVATAKEYNPINKGISDKDSEVNDAAADTDATRKSLLDAATINGTPKTAALQGQVAAA